VLHAIPDNLVGHQKVAVLKPLSALTAGHKKTATITGQFAPDCRRLFSAFMDAD